MTFSFIIVNWNVRELLEKCLLSIEKFNSHFSYEIIVADNASMDGSIAMMRERFPLINLIANTKNLGFAAGINQGIKQARGEYAVLLNPDVEIMESTLKNLLEEFEKSADSGIVGGKIKNEDGSIQPSVRSFPDVFTQVLITLKLNHIFNSRAIGRYLAKNFDYEKRQEVDQVMGAFFAIRRKVIKQIGMMDERFFLWFEEVDFCKRAKDAGWKIIYTPKTEVIHLGGKSFGQISSAKRQMIFNESLRYYMRKHKGIFIWLIFALIHPASIALAFITGIFHPKLSSYKARVMNHES
ncbi:glycosyltransferase family 2 protein [Patescibacteria group bacterium]|nr:MAG: glycosyltransferase family 2 protein [Patescibacteria group bacterium]